MGRYDLSEAEWRIVEPLLPPGGRRPVRADDRRIVNGIFYVLRTGSPWRDHPERFGPYTTVYNRFNRWARGGVWLAVFEALAERSPQSLHLIDSSIVRVLQHAAGGERTQQALGRVVAIARRTGGVERVITIPGVSALDANATVANASVAYVMLKDWSERGRTQNLQAVYADLGKALDSVEEARVLVLPPPAIQASATPRVS